METDSNVMEKNQRSWKKIIFTTIVMSPSILVGMNLLYAVIAIPQMNLALRDTVLFEISMTVGALAGYFLNWIVVEKLGRRPALLFSILPNLIGWPLLFFDYNLITTFVGVWFNGLCIGAVGYCTLVYYRECTIKTNRLRGNLLLWLGISISCGMILVLSLGFFLDYVRICAVATILAAISFLLICFFVPESPAWLKKQGKDGDAEFIEKRLGIGRPILVDEDGASQPELAGEGGAPVAVVQRSAVFVNNVIEIVEENSTRPFHLLIMLMLLLLFSFCTSAFSYLVKDIDANTDKIVGMLFNRTSQANNSSSTDNNLGSGISTVLIDVLTLCVVVIIMGGAGAVLKIKKKE